MQLSIPIKAMKAAGSGFSTKGGTLTSSLILARDPQLPLEAVTKGYIDNRVVSISAPNIDTGVFSVERFPQFVGDISKGVGAQEVNLSPTGVTAGVALKVNIAATGRITASYALSADDIPSLNWNKLKTNVPVTLTGYGITDALRKSGGTLTGFLTINGITSQSLHVATKGYVDGVFSNNTNYVPGDLITRGGATPTGFLRANGGEVDKTTYSALYAVISEAYSTVGNIIPGAGRPWHHQYDINTTQTGNITWTNGDSFTYATGIGTNMMLGNKIHLMYANNTEAMGYTGTVDSTGAVTWAENAIRPPSGSRLYGTVVVAYNRIYFIGGFDNGVGPRAQTFSAAINSDGTIGTWIEGPSLLTPVYSAKAVVTKTRIYLIGGVPDQASTTSVVQYVGISASGFTSNWTAGPSVPEQSAQFSLAMIRNRVYMLGGYSTESGYRNTIYMTTINPDGVMGSWKVYGYLPINSAQNQSIVVKNRLYLLAGYNGVDRVTAVYSCAINADGSLGLWEMDGTLPRTIAEGNIFITSSKVLFVGYGGDGSSIISMTGTFTGGLNDYSSYYNGTVTPVVGSTFRLPDYTDKEVNGLRYFIKY